MSWWLRRRDSDGRTYYITSGTIVLILMAVPILGVLLAFLLPLVQACRVWLRG
jgi:hypothetical protein